MHVCIYMYMCVGETYLGYVLQPASQGDKDQQHGRSLKEGLGRLVGYKHRNKESNDLASTGRKEVGREW